MSRNQCWSSNRLKWLYKSTTLIVAYNGNLYCIISEPKLYILSSVTHSLICHTAIRFIPQTYSKVAMWATNIINLSRLHSHHLCQCSHYGELQYTWTIFTNKLGYTHFIKVSSQSKQAYMHTHNTVMPVWSLLRLTPIVDHFDATKH